MGNSSHLRPIRVTWMEIEISDRDRLHPSPLRVTRMEIENWRIRGRGKFLIKLV